MLMRNNGFRGDPVYYDKCVRRNPFSCALELLVTNEFVEGKDKGIMANGDKFDVLIVYGDVNKVGESVFRNPSYKLLKPDEFKIIRARSDLENCCKAFWNGEFFSYRDASSHDPSELVRIDSKSDSYSRVDDVDYGRFVAVPLTFK